MDAFPSLDVLGAAFEGETEIVEHGVTPVLHYDPLGRLVRTELPNGTQARVEFSPWEQRSYDPNDEVLGSAWHAERIALPAGDPERRAAVLTEAHAGTPTVTHLDHLGRAFLATEHNRDSQGADLFYETRAQLDVQGNVLRITDANGTIAEERTHGMLGQVLRTTSLEVGNRWAISDVLGAPLYATASRGFSTRHRYDQARRPTHTFVTRPDGMTFTATRTVYGEAAPTPTASNLRGRAFRVYDGAGLLEHEAFDVDGNLVRQSRRLAAAYAITPDWAVLDELTAPADMDAATTALLESEVFTTEASFDAMGRPVTKTTPDGSVLHLGYGDAGHLETVAANVRGAVTSTDFVTDLRYDARGQRTLVLYGNGTRTSYAYDSQTFRLTQLQTLRDADGHPHQDLRYTFDPAGNITEIRDLAQSIVFTSNAAVSAVQRFSYDAIYRLVHAEGREHESQGQPVFDDFTSRAAPEDPTGLRLYTEQYLYDLVGNILELQHVASGGNWTRRYSYDTETSGNRLLATSAPGDATGVYSHTYDHDAHGSMTAMPHLAAIAWDFADRMQSADLGGGGTVYFTYDAAGRRVRKIRENLAGTSTWERIYLGGFEIYREHVGTELRLERQTLHIGDDSGRVCLVETKTIEDAEPVATSVSLCRYQYGNHLGTVGLELDESGLLISYEEFHPYGTTAYRAANDSVEVSPSRYRYTGQERDEETGLGHHGARYYANWIGRWTAADPIGLGDGPNRFGYARGNPVRLSDLTGHRAAPPMRDLPLPPAEGPRELPNVTDPVGDEWSPFEEHVHDVCGDLNGCADLFEPEPPPPPKSSVGRSSRSYGEDSGSADLDLVDFTPVFGPVRDGRAAAVNLADAIFEGRTDDAIVSGLLTFSNTLFAIADVLTLGGATLAGGFAVRALTRPLLRQQATRTATRGVVRASGENGGRGLLDEAARGKVTESSTASTDSVPAATEGRKERWDTPENWANKDHANLRDQLRKEYEGYESGRHNEYPKAMRKELIRLADEADARGDLPEYGQRLREIAETYKKREGAAHRGGR